MTPPGSAILLAKTVVDRSGRVRSFILTAFRQGSGMCVESWFRALTREHPATGWNRWDTALVDWVTAKGEWRGERNVPRCPERHRPKWARWMNQFPGHRLR